MQEGRKERRNEGRKEETNKGNKEERKEESERGCLYYQIFQNADFNWIFGYKNKDIQNDKFFYKPKNS